MGTPLKSPQTRRVRDDHAAAHIEASRDAARSSGTCRSRTRARCASPALAAEPSRPKRVRTSAKPRASSQLSRSSQDALSRVRPLSPRSPRRFAPQTRLHSCCCAGGYSCCVCTHDDGPGLTRPSTKRPSSFGVSQKETVLPDRFALAVPGCLPAFRRGEKSSSSAPRLIETEKFLVASFVVASEAQHHLVASQTSPALPTHG